MEKVPYIINRRHGGYGYSTKAIDEYNKRRTKSNPDLKNLDYKDDWIIRRTNKIMVEIVKEMGDEASGKYAGLDIWYVNKDLINYIVRSEYDGLENITYDVNKYKVDKIKEIIESTVTEIEKCSEIKKVIDFELSDADYDFENP